MSRKSQKGFTLVELVIVMAVIAVILSVVIPNLRGMQAESQLTKAEGELNTLKTAITSYWRNNSNAYPSNITTDLTGASPQIIPANLQDPFNTASGTYGYTSGTDSVFGDYFAVYTKGPKADTTSVTWDTSNKRISYGGGGRVISNAPVSKN
jgi:prepilin-type N-terminal cleavage/methylation domain-containing protein